MGMNSSRAQQPPGGVAPPVQRLEPADAPGLHRDDRLVHDGELQVVDGVSQVGFDLQARHGALPHRRIEELIGRRLAGLRAMERDGSVLQNVLRSGIAGGTDGDANGAGHEHLVSLDVERLRQRRSEPVRHPDRVARVGDVLQEDRELVGSQASQRGTGLHPDTAAVLGTPGLMCDRIRGAETRLQPTGDRDEQTVRRQPSETVVHRLEAVETESERSANA